MASLVNDVFGKDGLTTMKKFRHVAVNRTFWDWQCSLREMILQISDFSNLEELIYVLEDCHLRYGDQLAGKLRDVPATMEQLFPMMKATGCLTFDGLEDPMIRFCRTMTQAEESDEVS